MQAWAMLSSVYRQHLFFIVSHTGVFAVNNTLQFVWILDGFAKAHIYIQHERIKHTLSWS